MSDLTAIDGTRMKVTQAIALIALGAGACLAGYFLAHALFAERIITLLGPGTEEFARGIIGDVLFQVVCGAPFPLIVGAVVAGLVILVDQFIRIPPAMRLPLVFIVAFVSGFLGYFPYQFVMLLGSAF
ncbi:MAG TPA: hypothetical protein VJK02_20750 [Anaerolineales bacterium]|nr:hypothetical protein [Anaerolineales bacterium]